MFVTNLQCSGAKPHDAHEWGYRGITYQCAGVRARPHDEHRTGRRRLTADTPSARPVHELAGLLMRGTVQRAGTVALVPKSEAKR